MLRVAQQQVSNLMCDRPSEQRRKIDSGAARDLQHQLARDGFNVRIYVPYGKHWYPYFMRRLAERPANIWFVLKNLAKG